MPVPAFVVELRNKIGHDRLWLVGLSAVVTDDAGRILLTHRRDNQEWALPSGILEPGEEPAQAMVREVAEEACVQVDVERLSSVLSDPQPFTLPNGDICQYLNLTFACCHIGGEAAVGDDENLAVAWFAVDELPPLNARNIERLHTALAGSHEVVLRR